MNIDCHDKYRNTDKQNTQKIILFLFLRDDTFWACT